MAVGSSTGAGLSEAIEVIIRQPGHPDRVIRVRDGTMRMGRAEDNDIILADVGVSRRHARLVTQNGKCRIEDMGSGNGTYYRGRRVEAQALNDGDEVIIDPFVLRVRLKGGKQTISDGTLDGQEAGARLDVLTGPAMARSTYAIGPRGITMGRSETRDVIIPDPASSRHHCSIFPQEGRYILRDMGSANGTYLNGNRVRETELTDGDRVRIGNTEFRFVIGDATKVADSAHGGTPAAPPPRDFADIPIEESLPGRRARPSIKRRSSTMSSLVPMAFGGLVAVGVLFFMAVIVVVGLLVMSGGPEERPPRPLTWSLKLPQDLPPASVQDLFNQGTMAIKERKNKDALGAFYRSLQLQPGNEYGERLALLAGEFVVLDVLEPELKAAVQAREEREARREELLKQANWRSKKGYQARKALEVEFRNDPVVLEARDFRVSNTETEFQALLAEADEALTKHNAPAAREAVNKAWELAEEPSWRAQAREREVAVRRALAEANRKVWTEAVLAEANGERDKALGLYTQILTSDPDNASAQLRIGRLKRP